MRKFLSLLTLFAMLGVVSGCVSFRDREYNRQRKLIIRRDLKKLDRDIQHMFKWHEPSSLTDTEEPL